MPAGASQPCTPLAYRSLILARTTQSRISLQNQNSGPAPERGLKEKKGSGLPVTFPDLRDPPDSPSATANFLRPREDTTPAISGRKQRYPTIWLSRKSSSSTSPGRWRPPWALPVVPRLPSTSSPKYAYPPSPSTPPLTWLTTPQRRRHNEPVLHTLYCIRLIS